MSRCEAAVENTSVFSRWHSFQSRGSGQRLYSHANDRGGISPSWTMRSGVSLSSCSCVSPLVLRPQTSPPATTSRMTRPAAPRCVKRAETAATWWRAASAAHTRDSTTASARRATTARACSTSAQVGHIAARYFCFLSPLAVFSESPPLTWFCLYLQCEWWNSLEIIAMQAF